MMFKKILVPLDGSLMAESALEAAMQLGRAFHAEILLVRSFQLVYAGMPMTAGADWVWPQYAVEDSRREVYDYLETTRHAYDCPDCHVRSVALEGDAASCIVDMAHAENVDLIVMTTHGQTGIRRAVFGSVTERVLHSVDCPVIVTRSNEPIRRILITLDGSPLAELAIPPTLELARAIGARIILLRVNEIIPVNPVEAAITWDWDIPEPEQKLLNERRHAAEIYLKDVVTRFDLSQSEVEIIVLDGTPVDRIQEFARLYGIDLIAMSTHGHTGLRRWLYGSVSSKVMRASHCSMLIVRPPEEELHR